MKRHVSLLSLCPFVQTPLFQGQEISIGCSLLDLTNLKNYSIPKQDTGLESHFNQVRIQVLHSTPNLLSCGISPAWYQIMQILRGCNKLEIASPRMNQHHHHISTK